ncbi:LacI family transcriptional regulator [Arthrobacter sp. SW1]|uniref:LacI family DNA-binding transcriptional regulator n=1 Tax=Arthrobacter sp. SW1 TaxID=1920889 RepID=UPI000877C3C4|nr:LacI family DNA-binding transcriptional regulator [Arthrobacter sp. SW1]OFI37721.1 LacI family transcriptional regulator [Arthrobacter sp. SW1]
MARDPHAGVTIRDVARRAGVSITTVSHALNGKGAIGDATRERVRAVAEEMGYVADAMARGLRSSRMDAIGLVFRSLDSLGDYGPNGVDVFMRIAGAAAAETLNRNLGLMLVPDLSRGKLPPFSMSLDGYIVFTPHLDDPVVDLLRKRRIPYVTWDRDPSRPDFQHWVSHDDAASTERVLDHLAAAGAREVSYVGGTDRNAWNLDSEAAYLEWCARRGLAPRVYHVPERSGVDGGREAAARFLADGVLAGGGQGAVYCLTGRHASGVAQFLQEQGLRIPEDVLLCSGADSEHTRQSQPAISGLDVDTTAAAQALVETLCALMDGKPYPGPRLLPALFHERESTAGLFARGGSVPGRP